MANFFLEIFNLSLAACWLIGAIVAVRAIFAKSMPKWLVCCLWGLVAVRLLVPVTLESNISLVPNQQLELLIPNEGIGEVSEYVEESLPSFEENGIDSTVSAPVTDEAVSSPVTDEEFSAPIVDETVSSPVTDEEVSSPVTDEAVSAPIIEENASAPVTDENISASVQDTVIGDQNTEDVGKTDVAVNGNIVQSEKTEHSKKVSSNFATIAFAVWAIGFFLMLEYSVVSYILLKKRVAMSFPCGDKVRKGEGVDSPFIFGLFRPRIYIPFGLSQRTEECVIAHERAHFKRRDYLIKPFAFFILSVHWFNPFVWLAYILLCRDIEYACDEKVVDGLDADSRKAYALALLECAVAHRRITACPVAFGETGVKERVKNTMKYKKPAFWIVIVCVIVCIAVAVLFLTTGVGGSEDSDTSSEASDTSSEASDPSLEASGENQVEQDEKNYIDDLFAAEFVEYEDLGKYQNCVRFESSVEYNVMSVLITPKTTIYDFKIYSLEDNIDTVTLENILFEAKSISADKPLLADIEFGDILAENGISFTDENGNEYLYKLVDSAYDGKLIVSDVTTEASEESDGTLIVNGIDITKGSGVKIYDDRAELPFVAIMEALGISFEWKTDSTAIMTYGSIKPYLLDVKKGELTDYVGGDGRNHFTAYSDSPLGFVSLEKEILIDDVNAAAFFSEMGFVFRISYFDINFKDKIISIGRDTNDYKCTLIVNGNDITDSTHVVMKSDDGNYTLLPFVEIMEVLGAEFEWESDYVAKIEFLEMRFALNVKECKLIAEENDVNLISPPLGGTRKFSADKKELIVDNVTLKQFFDAAGINALYDYNKKIVTISTKSSGNEASNNEPHVHVYGEWKTVTAATCQSTGVVERVCSCGDKQLQSVNITQHKYVNGVCSCGAIESASDIEDGTLTFSMTNGGYKVSGKGFNGSVVVIPSTFMGKPVVEIAQDAFGGNRNIERVVIPKTVKTIGSHAFLHCFFLREVIFEEGSELISIGDSAFNNTAIVSITLPEGLKTIGEGAFNSCDDMKEITLPSTLKSIGSNAFRYSTVSKVTVKDIGKWCTVSFGNEYANPAYISQSLYAPDGSLVTRVNVSNGASEISAYAFCGVKTIESVSIPSTVKKIGVDAFADCKTLDVYITDLTKWAQVSVASADSLPGKRLFLNGVEIKDVVIPSGVTSIGSYAFSFASLTSVTVPDTVKTIGEGAFHYCTNLQSIKLSKNLTEIPKNMLYGASSLKTVVIPNTVKTIGESAFEGCISLESMFIPASVTYIGKHAFENCGSLKEFEFEVKDGWVCAATGGDYTVHASDLSTSYKTIAKIKDYNFAPWVRR